jgi:hypothetical protein
LTCDFTYLEPVGEITAFTYDETTKKLVMTGTKLPSDIESLRYVEFALS